MKARRKLPLQLMQQEEAEDLLHVAGALRHAVQDAVGTALAPSQSLRRLQDSLGSRRTPLAPMLPGALRALDRSSTVQLHEILSKTCGYDPCDGRASWSSDRDIVRELRPRLEALRRFLGDDLGSEYQLSGDKFLTKQILNRLNKGALRMTGPVFTGVMNIAPFGCLTPDVTVLLDNVIDILEHDGKLLETVLEKFPFKPSNDIYLYLSGILKNMATSSSQLAARKKALLSQLVPYVNSARCKHLSPPGVTSYRDILKVIRDDEYPVDVIHARDTLQSALESGGLDRYLSGFVPDRHNSNRRGLLLAFLQHLAGSLPNAHPASVYVHALLIHAKFSYLISVDAYFLPRSHVDIAMLINGFGTLGVNTTELANELYTFFREQIDWKSILQEFPYQKYSQPRNLLLAMLNKTLQYSAQLKLCHKIVIQSLIDRVTAVTSLTYVFPAVQSNITSLPVPVAIVSEPSETDIEATDHVTFMDETTETTTTTAGHKRKNVDVTIVIQNDTCCSEDRKMVTINLPSLFHALDRDTPYVLFAAVDDALSRRQIHVLGATADLTRGELLVAILHKIREGLSPGDPLVRDIENLLPYVKTTGPGALLPEFSSVCKDVNLTETTTPSKELTSCASSEELSEECTEPSLPITDVSETDQITTEPTTPSFERCATHTDTLVWVKVDQLLQAVDATANVTAVDLVQQYITPDMAHDFQPKCYNTSGELLREMLLHMKANLVLPEEVLSAIDHVLLHVGAGGSVTLLCIDKDNPRVVLHVKHCDTDMLIPTLQECFNEETSQQDFWVMVIPLGPILKTIDAKARNEDIDVLKTVLTSPEVYKQFRGFDFHEHKSQGRTLAMMLQFLLREGDVELYVMAALERLLPHVVTNGVGSLPFEIKYVCGKTTETTTEETLEETTTEEIFGETTTEQVTKRPQVSCKDCNDGTLIITINMETLWTAVNPSVPKESIEVLEDFLETSQYLNRTKSIYGTVRRNHTIYNHGSWIVQPTQTPCISGRGNQAIKIHLDSLLDIVDDKIMDSARSFLLNPALYQNWKGFNQEEHTTRGKLLNGLLTFLQTEMELNDEMRNTLKEISKHIISHRLGASPPVVKKQCKRTGVPKRKGDELAKAFQAAGAFPACVSLDSRNNTSTSTVQLVSDVTDLDTYVILKDFDAKGFKCQGHLLDSLLRFIGFETDVDAQVVQAVINVLFYVSLEESECVEPEVELTCAVGSVIPDRGTTIKGVVDVIDEEKSLSSADEPNKNVIAAAPNKNDKNIAYFPEPCESDGALQVLLPHFPTLFSSIDPSVGNDTLKAAMDILTSSKVLKHLVKLKWPYEDTRDVTLKYIIIYLTRSSGALTAYEKLLLHSILLKTDACGGGEMPSKFSFVCLVDGEMQPGKGKCDDGTAAYGLDVDFLFKIFSPQLPEKTKQKAIDLLIRPEFYTHLAGFRLDDYNSQATLFRQMVAHLKMNGDLDAEKMKDLTNMLDYVQNNEMSNAAPRLTNIGCHISFVKEENLQTFCASTEEGTTASPEITRVTQPESTVASEDTSYAEESTPVRVEMTTVQPRKPSTESLESIESSEPSTESMEDTEELTESESDFTQESSKVTTGTSKPVSIPSASKIVSSETTSESPETMEPTRAATETTSNAPEQTTENEGTELTHVSSELTSVTSQETCESSEESCESPDTSVSSSETANESSKSTPVSSEATNEYFQPVTLTTEPTSESTTTESSIGECDSSEESCKQTESTSISSSSVKESSEETIEASESTIQKSDLTPLPSKVPTNTPSKRTSTQTEPTTASSEDTCDSSEGPCEPVQSTTWPSGLTISTRVSESSTLPSETTSESLETSTLLEPTTAPSGDTCESSEETCKSSEETSVQPESTDTTSESSGWTILPLDATREPAEKSSEQLESSELTTETQEKTCDSSEESCRSSESTIESTKQPTEYWEQSTAQSEPTSEEQWESSESTMNSLELTSESLETTKQSTPSTGTSEKTIAPTEPATVTSEEPCDSSDESCESSESTTESSKQFTFSSKSTIEASQSTNLATEQATVPTEQTVTSEEPCDSSDESCESSESTTKPSKQLTSTIEASQSTSLATEQASVPREKTVTSEEPCDSSDESCESSESTTEPSKQLTSTIEASQSTSLATEQASVPREKTVTSEEPCDSSDETCEYSESTTEPSKQLKSTIEASQSTSLATEQATVPTEKTVTSEEPCDSSDESCESSESTTESSKLFTFSSKSTIEASQSTNLATEQATVPTEQTVTSEEPCDSSDESCESSESTTEPSKQLKSTIKASQSTSLATEQETVPTEKTVTSEESCDSSDELCESSESTTEPSKQLKSTIKASQSTSLATEQATVPTEKTVTSEESCDSSDELCESSESTTEPSKQLKSTIKASQSTSLATEQATVPTEKTVTSEESCDSSDELCESSESTTEPSKQLKSTIKASQSTSLATEQETVPTEKTVTSEESCDSSDELCESSESTTEPSKQLKSTIKASQSTSLATEQATVPTEKTVTSEEPCDSSDESCESSESTTEPSKQLKSTIKASQSTSLATEQETVPTEKTVTSEESCDSSDELCESSESTTEPSKQLKSTIKASQSTSLATEQETVPTEKTVTSEESCDSSDELCESSESTTEPSKQLKSTIKASQSTSLATEQETVPTEKTVTSEEPCDSSDESCESSESTTEPSKQLKSTIKASQSTSLATEQETVPTEKTVTSEESCDSSDELCESSESTTEPSKQLKSTIKASQSTSLATEQETVPTEKTVTSEEHCDSSDESCESSESTTEPSKKSKSTIEASQSTSLATEQASVPTEKTVTSEEPCDSSDESCESSESTTEPSKQLKSTIKALQSTSLATEQATVPTEKTVTSEEPCDSSDESCESSESTTEPSKQLKSTIKASQSTSLATEQATVPTEKTVTSEEPCDSSDESCESSESTTEPSKQLKSTIKALQSTSLATEQATVPTEKTVTSEEPCDSSDESCESSESTTEPSKQLKSTIKASQSTSLATEQASVPTEKTVTSEEPCDSSDETCESSESTTEPSKQLKSTIKALQSTSLATEQATVPTEKTVTSEEPCDSSDESCESSESTTEPSKQFIFSSKSTIETSQSTSLATEQATVPTEKTVTSEEPCDSSDESCESSESTTESSKQLKSTIETSQSASLPTEQATVTSENPCDSSDESCESSESTPEPSKQLYSTTEASQSTSLPTEKTTVTSEEPCDSSDETCESSESTTEPSKQLKSTIEASQSTSLATEQTTVISEEPCDSSDESCESSELATESSKPSILSSQSSNMRSTSVFSEHTTPQTQPAIVTSAESCDSSVESCESSESLEPSESLSSASELIILSQESTTVPSEPSTMPSTSEESSEFISDSSEKDIESSETTNLSSESTILTPEQTTAASEEPYDSSGKTYESYESSEQDIESSESTTTEATSEPCDVSDETCETSESTTSQVSTERTRGPTVSTPETTTPSSDSTKLSQDFTPSAPVTTAVSPGLTTSTQETTTSQPGRERETASTYRSVVLTTSPTPEELPRNVTTSILVAHPCVNPGSIAVLYANVPDLLLALGPNISREAVAAVSEILYRDEIVMALIDMDWDTYTTRGNALYHALEFISDDDLLSDEDQQYVRTAMSHVDNTHDGGKPAVFHFYCVLGDTPVVETEKCGWNITAVVKVADVLTAVDATAPAEDTKAVAKFFRSLDFYKYIEGFNFEEYNTRGELLKSLLVYLLAEVKLTQEMVRSMAILSQHVLTEGVGLLPPNITIVCNTADLPVPETPATTVAQGMGTDEGRNLNTNPSMTTEPTPPEDRCVNGFEDRAVAFPGRCSDNAVLAPSVEPSSLLEVVNPGESKESVEKVHQFLSSDETIYELREYNWDLNETKAELLSNLLYYVITSTTLADDNMKAHINSVLGMIRMAGPGEEMPTIRFLCLVRDNKGVQNENDNSTLCQGVSPVILMSVDSLLEALNPDVSNRSRCLVANVIGKVSFSLKMNGFDVENIATKADLLRQILEFMRDNMKLKPEVKDAVNELLENITDKEQALESPELFDSCDVTLVKEGIHILNPTDSTSEEQGTIVKPLDFGICDDDPSEDAIPEVILSVASLFKAFKRTADREHLSTLMALFKTHEFPLYLIGFKLMQYTTRADLLEALLAHLVRNESMPLPQDAKNAIYELRDQVRFDGSGVLPPKIVIVCNSTGTIIKNITIRVPPPPPTSFVSAFNPCLVTPSGEGYQLSMPSLLASLRPDTPLPIITSLMQFFLKYDLTTQLKDFDVMRYRTQGKLLIDILDHLINKSRIRSTEKEVLKQVGQYVMSDGFAALQPDLSTKCSVSNNIIKIVDDPLTDINATMSPIVIDYDGKPCDEQTTKENTRLHVLSLLSVLRKDAPRATVTKVVAFVSQSQFPKYLHGFDLMEYSTRGSMMHEVLLFLSDVPGVERGIKKALTKLVPFVRLDGPGKLPSVIVTYCGAQPLEVVTTPVPETKEKNVCDGHPNGTPTSVIDLESLVNVFERGAPVKQKAVIYGFLLQPFIYSSLKNFFKLDKYVSQAEMLQELLAFLWTEPGYGNDIKDAAKKLLPMIQFEGPGGLPPVLKIICMNLNNSRVYTNYETEVEKKIDEFYFEIQKQCSYMDLNIPTSAYYKLDLDALFAAFKPNTPEHYVKLFKNSLGKKETKQMLLGLDLDKAMTRGELLHTILTLVKYSKHKSSSEVKEAIKHLLPNIQKGGLANLPVVVSKGCKPSQSDGHPFSNILITILPEEELTSEMKISLNAIYDALLATGLDFTPFTPPVEDASDKYSRHDLLRFILYNMRQNKQLYREVRRHVAIVLLNLHELDLQAAIEEEERRNEEATKATNNKEMYEIDYVDLLKVIRVGAPQDALGIIEIFFNQTDFKQYIEGFNAQEYTRQGDLLTAAFLYLLNLTKTSPEVKEAIRKLESWVDHEEIGFLPPTIHKVYVRTKTEVNIVSLDFGNLFRAIPKKRLTKETKDALNMIFKFISSPSVNIRKLMHGINAEQSPRIQLKIILMKLKEFGSEEIRQYIDIVLNYLHEAMTNDGSSNAQPLPNLDWIQVLQAVLEDKVPPEVLLAKKDLYTFFISNTFKNIAKNYLVDLNDTRSKFLRDLLVFLRSKPELKMIRQSIAYVLPFIKEDFILAQTIIGDDVIQPDEDEDAKTGENHLKELMYQAMGFITQGKETTEIIENLQKIFTVESKLLRSVYVAFDVLDEFPQIEKIIIVLRRIRQNLRLFLEEDTMQTVDMLLKQLGESSTIYLGPTSFNEDLLKLMTEVVGVNAPELVQEAVRNLSASVDIANIRLGRAFNGMMGSIAKLESKPKLAVILKILWRVYGRQKDVSAIMRAIKIVYEYFQPNKIGGDISAEEQHTAIIAALMSVVGNDADASVHEAKHVVVEYLTSQQNVYDKVLGMLVFMNLAPTELVARALRRFREHQVESAPRLWTAVSTVLHYLRAEEHDSTEDENDESFSIVNEFKDLIGEAGHGASKSKEIVLKFLVDNKSSLMNLFRAHRTLFRYPPREKMSLILGRLLRLYRQKLDTQTITAIEDIMKLLESTQQSSEEVFAEDIDIAQLLNEVVDSSATREVQAAKMLIDRFLKDNPNITDEIVYGVVIQEKFNSQRRVATLLRRLQRKFRQQLSTAQTRALMTLFGYLQMSADNSVEDQFIGQLRFDDLFSKVFSTAENQEVLLASSRVLKLLKDTDLRRVLKGLHLWKLEQDLQVGLILYRMTESKKLSKEDSHAVTVLLNYLQYDLAELATEDRDESVKPEILFHDAMPGDVPPEVEEARGILLHELGSGRSALRSVYRGIDFSSVPTANGRLLALLKNVNNKRDQLGSRVSDALKTITDYLHLSLNDGEIDPYSFNFAETFDRAVPSFAPRVVSIAKLSLLQAIEHRPGTFKKILDNVRVTDNESEQEATRKILEAIASYKRQLAPKVRMAADIVSRYLREERVDEDPSVQKILMSTDDESDSDSEDDSAIEGRMFSDEMGKKKPKPSKPKRRGSRRRVD